MGIRVVTLNVWALPAGLARHERERMAAIAEALPGLRPDLIAFQEIWTQESLATLAEGARQAGLDSIWHPERTRGGSGLMIASRFPLRDLHFEAYEAGGFPERLRHLDYWGGKGFVAATVDTPEGPIRFANTHLHAKYANIGEVDDYLGTRTAQLIQFAAGMERESGLPLIAAGDFNIGQASDSHGLLRAFTGLNDVAADLGRTQNTSRRGNPYRRPTSRGKRIDYVFERAGDTHEWVAESIAVILDAQLRFEGEVGNYSDHAGLLAELRLRERSEPRTPWTPAHPWLRYARETIDVGRDTGSSRRGDQRIRAGVAAAGLAASGIVVKQSRRSFLRGTAVAAGAACAALAGGNLWLSEAVAPREVAAFDAAARRLDAWEARAGPARSQAKPAVPFPSPSASAPVPGTRIPE